MHIGPKDPQRQSARTRADQLELPPPNVGVRRSDNVDGWRHAGSQPTRPQTLIDQISALKHIALSAEIYHLECSPVASSSCQAASVHRRCLFSSTLSLGGGRARVDSLDLRLSASVARQAQTTVSAIGGLRLAAPCSVAAASARAGRAAAPRAPAGAAAAPQRHVGAQAALQLPVAVHVHRTLSCRM